MTGRPFPRVAAAPFGGKGRRPFPDRILTTVNARITRALLAALGAAAASLFLAGGAATAGSGSRVLAIRFGPDLEVNPVTQDYLTGQLSRAARDGYDAAVILLDTPGGLSTSMKTIYTAELNAKLPVIVYVSPDGARAASAGVWISEAADVLAMAPTTNIGSSTPIDSSGKNLVSDLRRKVINDAAASLTALAAAHRRNTAWPAKAVRVASNLTAAQALKMNVIDLVAPSLPALLQKLDGYRTKDAERPYTLHLAGAQVDDVGPGFFTRLLNTLIDPNIISLLFLAGIVGIGFEIFHPGVVLPGALGVVALLTALFGFSVLPISWSGLALILLGIALLVIDAHVVSHGALTVSGLIALAVGMLMLFHNAPAPYHTSVTLVVSLTVAIGAIWAFALTKAVQVRRRPPSVMPARVIGAEAVVRGPGQVFVLGELWRARRADGGDLRPGEHVRVAAIDGLELTVTPAEETAGVG
jgi:membrane-bound serine protease (ClpP class)